MPTLGPLEWISAVECGAATNRWHSVLHNVWVSFCGYVGEAVISPSDIVVYSYDDMGYQAGDYLVRVGLHYPITFTSTFSAGFKFTDGSCGQTATAGGWTYRSQDTEFYPVATGDASQWTTGDIEYRRSDGTLVGKWVVTQSPCYTVFNACTGEMDDSRSDTITESGV